MKKSEFTYKYLNFKKTIKPRSITFKCNKLGLSGWEIVSCRETKTQIVRGFRKLEVKIKQNRVDWGRLTKAAKIADMLEEGKVPPWWGDRKGVK